MSATYDNSLASTRDWVRFLIGDTDVSPTTDALFADEEIDAVLVEQSNKYLAAARLLSNLRMKWASAGRGVAMKTVDALTIKWGGAGEKGKGMDAIDSRIAELRRLGSPTPAMFESLGARA